MSRANQGATITPESVSNLNESAWYLRSRRLVFHLKNLNATRQLTLALFLSAFCSFQVAASDESSSVTMRVHLGNGTVAQYYGFPESAIKLLFPTGEAALEPNVSIGNWKSTSSPILKKIQVVSVSDTAGRFSVVGATFGDQLFVFDGVFSSDNSIPMSALIRATNSSPRDEAQALGLAKFYLALAYYRLEDPDRFVAQRTTDSATKAASENAKTYSDMIGVSHSPQAFRQGDGYKVDFYTFDPREVVPRRVNHWQIVMGGGNLEERVSAHNEGFHELNLKEKADSANTGEKLRFAAKMMANGSTDDGAITDLQYWTSSDGPGIQRTHYYYGSHELAEKRMQNFLQNAVAIIETRPWLDNHVKSVGTQALLIRAAYSEKTLMASQVSEDETSVLEISCWSLHNLLTAVGRELPDRKK